MKKKLLTTLLAAVLCTPQVAFAARDGEGMEYTSASEGFYGSIRTMYTSKAGADKTNGGKIQADGSRLGVRGTLDLGHGLTGLYRYEWSVSGDNGSAIGNTRLSYVGLRGSWGEFQVGSHWENDYNWVTAATDVATTGSGNFAPHFRRKNSFQYATPDINGFQGSFRFGLDGNAKTDGGPAPIEAVSVRVSVGVVNNDVPVNVLAATAPSENVDEWAIAAKYSTHGFTFGGAYEVRPDALRSQVLTASGVATNAGVVTITPSDGKAEDATFWALRMGYGQDNWSVNGWYGEHNTSDLKGQVRAGAAIADVTQQDTKIFSVAGNIDLGKFAVVGIFETNENPAAEEDSVFIANVDYKFTSRSKAYLAYIANDFDSSPNKADEVRVGLRMDF
ncbi:MAG: porin [Gammaproteobacteria bacterium]